MQTGNSAAGKHASVALVMTAGSAKGRSFALNEGGVYRIGRSPESEIALDPQDKSVSRLHARVQVKSGRILFANASQTNPAVVNGKLALKTLELRNGDTLRIGASVFQLHTARTAGGPDKKTIKTGEEKRPVLLYAVAGVVVLIAVLAGVKRFISDRGGGSGDDTLTISSNASDPLLEGDGLPMASLSNAPGKGGNTQADSLFHQGLFFYDAGKLKNAIDRFEAALKAQPDHTLSEQWLMKTESELAASVDVHYQKALQHMKYMRYGEAVTEFTIVVQLSQDPADEKFMNAKEQLLKLKGK
ncbi:MAG: hypothetical protein CSA22_02575 [Deltaproteobacteria bacterium]|nr:MAG: hypothetical protein CSA22_02575 [Deltaproteobacteria bacterium]